MGLTKPRAAQIFNLDYKQSTRVVTTTNITLTGGAPNSVDGINLSVNDRILVTGQNTGSQNGLYLVTTLGSGSNGTWARTSDGNENGEIEAGMIVMVTEGTVYADTQWKLITDDPIVIGTTALTFTQNYMANSISGGTSNVVVNTNAAVTISSAGTANVISVGNIAVTFTGNVNPSANVTYTLGNTTNRWKDLWLSNSSIYLGNIVLAATATALTVDGVPVVTSAGGAISATGNITGGNLITGGLVSATGNVTGNYILGNGALLTGVITSVANINNGTSNVTVVSSGGNVTIGVGGTGNVAVFANTGLFVTGVLSATGNITGGNVLTAGLISATGAVTGAAITGTSLTVTTGNITAGNLLLSGAIIDSAQLDIQTSAANANIALAPNGTGIVTVSTQVSAVGNVTGGNLLTAGLITATGNITGGNIRTAGVVSATGDMFGKELWSTQSSGDEGGQVNLGIPAANTALTGQVTIDVYQNQLRFFQGNSARGAYIDLTAAAVGVGSNLLAGGGGGTPGGANTNVQFNDGGVFGGTAGLTFNKTTNAVATTGTFSATGNVAGGNILTGGLISATGNVTGGNLIAGTGASGNITGANVITANTVTTTANITGGNILTSGLISATGAITGAALTGTSLTVSTGNVSCGNIVNTNANGVGNIGSSATRFNQVFALASSAQYADLAEKYTADADYAPGTVLEFGGDQEVTATTTSHSPRVAGVVSTQPSYIMNDGLVSDHTAMVSLTGRVPCLVQGPVAKGDRLVASDVVGHAQRLDPTQYEPGCIIGKALEDYPSGTTGTIEVAVGRF
jgi:hypothetical protein